MAGWPGSISATRSTPPPRQRLTDRARRACRFRFLGSDPRWDGAVRGGADERSGADAYARYGRQHGAGRTPRRVGRRNGSTESDVGSSERVGGGGRPTIAAGSGPGPVEAGPVLRQRGGVQVVQHDLESALHPGVVGGPVRQLVEGQVEVVAQSGCGTSTASLPWVSRCRGGSEREASRRSRSWSWSRACTAVVGSLTPGDSAREAMSTSWRNPNPTSSSRPRSSPRRTASLSRSSSSRRRGVVVEHPEERGPAGNELAE